jgi:O-antigen/teichoic acid export membrane protein
LAWIDWSIGPVQINSFKLNNMSLRKNTFWNLLGGGLPLLAAVVCIPYCLNRLGSEAFGVLTLIWALIGYFSLFDLGIGRALTYEISRLQSKDPIKQISSVLRAGLLLTILTGLIGAVIMYLIAPSLAYEWLKISPQIAPDAQKAFELAAWGVILTTIACGLRGAQEGLEQFKIANTNKAILGIATFFLPALSVYLHGPILYPIVLYLIGARITVVLINLYQLRQFLLVTHHNTFLNSITSLYSFGIWMTITGIVGPLMVYGDRFFVSTVISVGLLPLYAIPQEGLQRLLLIPTSFCSALLPKLAGLNSGERNLLYEKSFKHVAWIMLVVSTLSALVAYPVLTIWLGAEFAKQSVLIVCILAVGIWLNSMAFVPYTFLHAMGNTKITAIFHMIELVLYGIVLYYLVHFLGLIGAALAWVFRVALDLFLLQWFARKVQRT